MKALVHDYSGHPFQVQLSRELARRGHEVTHSWCDAHVSGKGHLTAEPGETLHFRPIAVGETVQKLRFVRRFFQELRYGRQLALLAREVRPDVVLVSNVPIPMVVVMMLHFLMSRTPWVLWQQDVQSVAARSFAGTCLSPYFRAVASVMECCERASARLAVSVVVIAESFVEVHRRWRTDDKVTVIPNWAPLDEIFPVERKNDWAVENEVDDVKTLLYSGTLGLKHNPALLVALARAVIDAGQSVELVVVTEGPAVELLRSAAADADVPLRLLPFQPYERLSQVLGSGDILVVLLEKDAGAFSVPSKTLSYLCSGRPVLGLMPEENLAAQLVNQVGGFVDAPSAASVPAAAEWVVDVLSDQERWTVLGQDSRALAEQKFALTVCATQFEAMLMCAAERGRVSALHPESAHERRVDAYPIGA